LVLGWVEDDHERAAMPHEAALTLGWKAIVRNGVVSRI